MLVYDINGIGVIFLDPNCSLHIFSMLYTLVMLYILQWM